MPDQYRRIYDDDYRRGSRRNLPERARDDARPWLRDEDYHRPRRDGEERDERAWAGDRSWRDQGDGAYERGSRDRQLSYNGASDRDYGRDAYGGERDFFRGSEDQGDSPDRMPGSPSPEERYRQWRGSYNPDYFERGYAGSASRGAQGRSDMPLRGSRATYAGYRDGGVGSGESAAGFSYGRGSHYSRAGWRDGGDGASTWGRRSYAGRGPKGYQRSDDRVREDISEQLMDDPDIDASEITVQVSQGQVTLSGTVEDREQKRCAEDIVERVSGVSDITNNLRVARPSQASSFLSGQHTTGMEDSPSQASGSSKATKPTTSAT